MKLTLTQLLVLVFFIFSNLCIAQGFENTEFKTSPSMDWWLRKNNDTLPSINIEQAFDFINRNLKLKSSISVAVLDTDVDINHKDFQKVLWKNSKEKSKNKIDDDKNSFVDDIHGWNFIGKKENGISLDYTLVDETRILRKFSEKELNKLYKEKKVLFNYDDVKESYNQTLESLKKKIKRYEKSEPGYTFVMDTLKKIFNQKSFTLENINALKTKDTIIKKYIEYVKTTYKKGYPYNEFMDYLNFKRKSLEICMNLNYDNRELIGDDFEDIKDTRYGSPLVSGNTDKIDHGTKVSGVIARIFNLMEKDIKKRKLTIMPLVITGVGDPTDKDTSLAIRYAVDNGAKVINLSQSKSFSINDILVDKALCYADKKDVLIIQSAGNEGLDLDKNVRYPNDTNNEGKEIVSNLLVVGAVTQPKKGNKRNILYKNSNYGKNTVDIYAPGSKIKTLLPNNKYKTSRGTSYAAAIVSGIATLIRSYFPNLTATQVKQILMDSGVNYDVEIEIKTKSDSKKKVYFSELSKSGKVLNVYNALILADSIAK